MSPQITYKYLPPGVEPTEDARSLSEPLDICHVERVQETMSDAVGDLVWVHDLRNGGEQRSFKVVSVGRPTHFGFVEESSPEISNLDFYVTDAE